MGNYLNSPHCLKTSLNGEFQNLRYGSSAMQGWRTSMEDSFVIHPFQYLDCVDGPACLFGVYDGHGGSHVAQFVANHIVPELYKLNIMNFKNFESAVKSVYVSLDNLLSSSSCQTELAQLMNTNVEIVRPRINDINMNVRSQLYKSKLLNRSSIVKSKFQMNDSIFGNADASTLLNSAELDGYSESDITVRKCSTHSESSLRTPTKNDTIKSFVSKFKLTQNKVGKNKNKTRKSFFSRNHDKNQTDNIFEDMDQSSFDLSKKIGSVNEDSSIMKNVCCNTVENDNDQKIETPKQFEDKLLKPKRNSYNNNSSNLDSEFILTDEVIKKKTGECYSPKSNSTSFFSFQGIKSFISGMVKSSYNWQRNSLDLKCGLAFLAGCTAISVLVTNSKIIVINAGDSRCVLSRNKKAIDLSKDHKPTSLEEQVRIYRAGGSLYMGRVNGNLNLSRAIGDLLYKNNTSLPPDQQIISAVPDVTFVDISEKDDFLIIGCDGIWERLSSQEIVNFIVDRLNTTHKLSDIVESLFDELLSPSPITCEAGCDNMTAILVDLQGNARNAIS